MTTLVMATLAACSAPVEPSPSPSPTASPSPWTLSSPSPAPAAAAGPYLALGDSLAVGVAQAPQTGPATSPASTLQRDLGDVTTLADANVVSTIRDQSASGEE